MIFVATNPGLLLYYFEHMIACKWTSYDPPKTCDALDASTNPTNVIEAI